MLAEEQSTAGRSLVRSGHEPQKQQREPLHWLTRQEQTSQVVAACNGAGTEDVDGRVNTGTGPTADVDRFAMVVTACVRSGIASSYGL